MIDSNSGSRMIKVEFLVEFNILSNHGCPLHHNVLLHPIVLIKHQIAKVLTAIHPWKLISTELHFWQISLLEKESDAFCFALLWVWMPNYIEYAIPTSCYRKALS